MRSLTNVTLKNARKDKKETNKEKILGTISFLIVFATLSSLMIVTSYIFTKELEEIGKPYLFVNILLLANFIILLYSSIFSSINTLYFSKDLKLLLRMPLKSKDIIEAKIAEMIVNEYQMESILLAVPMIVYGILTKATSLFYIYSFIVLLLLPIIPILVTSLVNSIIMRITNIVKNKTRVMYITIILSTIIISMIFSFSNNDNLEMLEITENIGRKTLIVENNTVLNLSNKAQNISNEFLYLRTIMNILINYNNIKGINNLLIFIIMNIISYNFIIFIISKIYFKGVIGTTVNNTKSKNKKNKDINIRDCKSKNWVSSYIKKELLIIFRGPMFLIQCVISPLFFSTMIIVILHKILLSVNTNIQNIIINMINSTLGIVVLIIMGCFAFMVNFISIIGVSKESNNAKKIKYIPIDLLKQFKMKMFLGNFINLIAIIELTLFSYFYTNNKILAIELFAVLLSISTIGEKIKLLIDLRAPKLNWNSEFMMLKQNTNIMYVLFYTMIIAITLLALGFVITKLQLFIMIVLSISVFINVIFNVYIKKNISNIFKNVY